MKEGAGIPPAPSCSFPYPQSVFDRFGFGRVRLRPSNVATVVLSLILAFVAPVGSGATELLVLDASFQTDGTAVAVGEHGNILRRGPGLSDPWTPSAVPTDRMITAVEFASNTVGWAVAHDALILHTDDSGRTWRRQYEDPEALAPFLDIWASGETRAIAVGAYGLYAETSDAGNSWNSRLIDDEEPHFYSIASSPTDSLYIAGEFGTVLRSADQGQSWDRLDTPYAGTLFGVLPVQDDVILIFGLRGNLYRSENAGESWTRIDLGTTASLLAGTIARDGRIFLAGSAGTVLESRDGGRSFRSAGREDRLLLTRAFHLPEGLWLCSERGLINPEGKLVAMPRAAIDIDAGSEAP